MEQDFSDATWRKSRRSQTTTDQCVEVAIIGGSVGMRDSKEPDGPVLVLTSGDWRAFARAIKDRDA
ncbi:DUF397 domain-containing protein [Actinomadura sediminis]|uniref:DUF397 domain-containing protein n=1 Tax=Actinomadura sediminis TaxID=1038904 RepID=A0ABW3EP14_9ACTN